MLLRIFVHICYIYLHLFFAQSKRDFLNHHSLSLFHTHTTPHVSLNQLSVDGHVCHFYVLAVVNSAAVNTEVHVSFQISFCLFWIDAQE